MPKPFDLIKARLEINKHDLDEENVRHPQLIFEIVKELAMSNEDRDRRKRDLERVYSKLDQGFRDVPEGQKKPAESQIKEMIIREDEYQEAQEELAAAVTISALWEGALEAARARGYALRGLGELYLAQYFARESSGGGYEERNRRKDIAAGRVRDEQAKLREEAETRREGGNKRRSREANTD